MATAADCFATLSGVAKWVQRTLSADTNPTDSQSYEFMKNRSDEVLLLMSAKGAPYTLDNGSNPIPSGILGLRGVVTQLVEVGSAIDILAAIDVGRAPTTTDRIRALMDIQAQLFSRFETTLTTYVAGEAGSASISSDLTNGVSAPDFPATTSSEYTYTGKYDWLVSKVNW